MTGQKWLSKDNTIPAHVAIIGIGSVIGYMVAKKVGKKPLWPILISIAAVHAVVWFHDRGIVDVTPPVKTVTLTDEEAKTIADESTKF